MPKRRYLSLTPQQRTELIGIRDRDPRPYLRERAAALLKIADGASAHHVARCGLLKPRSPDTLYSWMEDYQHCGALRPQPARRKRLSPPGHRARGAAGDTAPAA